MKIKFFLLALGMVFLQPFVSRAVETMDLKQTYLALLKPYAADPAVLEQFWCEIESAYTGDRRYYHNMEHLGNFYQQLQKCKDSLTDYETAFLAMIYHDIVYFMPDGTNEEKSAAYAAKHLRQIGYPADKIQRCEALIMATKSHAGSDDMDTNYFVDADMSILGLDWPTYLRYAENIRKEYGDAPQFNKGRKRVLEHFLNMDRLFKTDLFFTLYEQRARENLRREIAEIINPSPLL